MDDIILIGNDDLEIKNLILQLEKKLKSKNLGIIGYLLGIEVSYSKQGIFLLPSHLESLWKRI